ncbi:MAG: hypothetical protein K0R67_1875 [Paenibacillus sp.]|nr:hypothetical protein [Paenibacillus sp.]
MYTFRGAMRDDCAHICKFPQNSEEVFYMFPSGQFPLQAEAMQEKAESRWQPTVVLDGDRIAGYGNMYGFEEGKHAWLGNFIINPEYRGKGAGPALIQEMIRLAGDVLGVPKLLLVCHHTNLRALLFYAKLGFKPFDLHQMKNHLGETIVGIQMQIATSKGQ